MKRNTSEYSWNVSEISQLKWSEIHQNTAEMYSKFHIWNEAKYIKIQLKRIRNFTVEIHQNTAEMYPNWLNIARPETNLWEKNVLPVTLFCFICRRINVCASRSWEIATTVCLGCLSAVPSTLTIALWWVWEWSKPSSKQTFFFVKAMNGKVKHMFVNMNRKIVGHKKTYQEYIWSTWVQSIKRWFTGHV